jgi:hypothetical protein
MIKMQTDIIRLVDDENYQYPLIEIKDGTFDLFEKFLDKYRENPEYNIDEFIEMLEEQDFFIRAIYWDYETDF